MSIMALLGLDIGTTGCKASIISYDGEILSDAYREYALVNTCENCFELNPILVWESTKEAIKEAIAKCNATISAISTSSLGEAFICLDVNGKELGNSIIYMDTRGEQECAELVERFGIMQIMYKTGHPPLPMYSINKLWWMKKHDVERFSKIAKIHFFGDYILYKLGGEHICDYSLGARSMAFNVIDKKWDKNILDACGIDEAMLPTPMLAGTIIGNIYRGIADELGICPGAKLVLGAHDQIMSALGAGVLKPGEAANGIGTVDCISSVFSKPILSKTMVDCSYNCIPYLFENTYVSYAFSMTGGSLLKWFRDTFAKEESSLALCNGLNFYQEMDRIMPNKPTDLFVVPHFAGSPMPNIDNSAKGAILNITFSSSLGEIYKACMEGETFEMKHNLVALNKNGIQFSSLKTIGGGSQSECFMQIRANIFGIPIVTLKNHEASALGTTILAGVATRVFSSVEEACDILVCPKKIYEPDLYASEYYSERFHKYSQLYELLKNVR